MTSYMMQKFLYKYNFIILNLYPKLHQLLIKKKETETTWACKDGFKDTRKGNSMFGGIQIKILGRI